MKSANQSSHTCIQPLPHTSESSGIPVVITPPRRRCATPLAWLFAALALSCFAPTNASAQIALPDPLPDPLVLGFVDGLDFNNLDFLLTTAGKTYYAVGGDGARAVIDHIKLDSLLNSDSDTIATQEGAHDGTNDQRSRIVGEYTLVLPTIAELTALVASTPFTALTDSDISGLTLWSANVATSMSADNHQAYSTSSTTATDTQDSTGHSVFFQVLPVPAPTFGTATIPNQIYPLGAAISLTLPAVKGGLSPLNYTLTGTPQIGLTFTADTRTFAGTPSTASPTPASLTYTVTDSRSDPGTASLIFTVKTVTVTVDTAAGETVEYLDGAIAAINIGGGAGGDNKNDMRLSLPSVNSVTAVAVTAYDLTADAVPPAPDGITFSDKALDITLTPDAATTPATVCLSTDGGLARGIMPALYRLSTATDPATWEKIGNDTSTHANFVCGTTTTFSPFAVGAEISFPDTLDLGTFSGVGTFSGFDLNLIHKVTTEDEKIYYYLDGDGNSMLDSDGNSMDDEVSHDMLDLLLNGGDDTIATQEGAHDGSDDERSVVVDEYTLVLPTKDEASALIIDPNFITTVLDSSERLSRNDDILTANLGFTAIGGTNPENHLIVALDVNRGIPVSPIKDNVEKFVFFQVLPAPTATPTFGIATIPNQIYPLDVDISVTLPVASGGLSPLSYTLTGTPPTGLSFTADTRIFAGTLSTASPTPASLIYTVTDARIATTFATPASLTFTVKTVTVTVDTAAGETVEYLDGAIAAINIGGGDGGDNKNDMRLSLPSVNSVTAVAVTAYDLTADAVPPAPDGITFSDKALDITLTPALTFAATMPATVCLSTAGLPEGGSPAIYHLPTATDPATDSAWEETGPATRTIDDFVCGTTTTFSPFAVGYTPFITETETTTRLNEQILTRASQAMTASTLEAVARRVEAAAGGTASSAGGAGATSGYAYQFGGQSSLSGLLKSHGKAMLEDNMEYEQLFDGASFVVPLSATEGGTGGGKPGAGALSLWGSSNFINLGNDNDGIDWDGQVISINVGVDKLVGEDILAGFALSLNQSGFDYVDSVSATKGEYNYSNTILHPYIGWFPGEDLKLWASVGFGSGEIEINDGRKHSTDTSQQSLSGGFNRWLLNSTELLPGNTTTLNLKGDVSMTSVDVEAKEGSFAEQKVSSTRLRVLVSGEQQRELASGGRLMPSVEAGVRYDGGDGVTGVGVELGGGLRYANPDGNLSVAGNVRTLLVGEYDELGVDFTVQLAPISGRGLSLTLRPVWGKTQSAAERLWNDGASEISGGDTALRGSVDTEVGYGLSATMLGSPGILTPYTGMTTQDGGSSRLRLGGRFAGGNGLSLNLEGTQKNTTDSASHQVLLRGEVGF